MKILIAPNAFKNSLDAWQVAQAIRQGLQESRLQASCLLQPIADGGDGMLDMMLHQTEGEKRYAMVEAPLGRPVEAAYGLIHNRKTAIIEMAEASGLRLLTQAEYNPMIASTFGTGQLIREALAQGVEEIIIGVGGSATVDGGAGMAMALGVKLLDSAGKPVAKGGRGLQDIHAIDLSGAASLQDVRIVVVCDVTHTFLEGPQVFGPQKGATPEMVTALAQGFEAYRQLILKQLGKDMAAFPYGGAAGGISAALHVLFDAELVNGTDFLLSQTGFYQDLSQCDLLISAEGAFDSQTRGGKGPFYVASQAKKLEKPVIMLAGSLPQDFKTEDYEIYDAVFPIGAKPESLDEAIQHTRENLTRTARQIGNLLALKKNEPPDKAAHSH